jgi:hypothetical protein
MRIETTSRAIYQFDELSESAQNNAIERYRESSYELFDADSLFDATHIGELLGIQFDTKAIPLMNGESRNSPNIYYSGFCSQGDGACFEGVYSYKKNSVRDIKAYAPLDSELHNIAESLFQTQRDSFFQLYAHCKQSGRYYHANSMRVNVERDSPYQDCTESSEDSITESLRDFCNWIYARLESEYEYITSEEYARESIQCNEYEFTESGELI